MPPLVSVIVPTYHRNKRLRRTIESVLNQGYPAVELLVIDDSGSGHARPVVDSYDDLIYIPLPENRGGNEARNAGIKRASGEYIHLLDDDDRLHPTRIDRGVSQLETSNAGVSYCGRVFENADTLFPDPEVQGFVLERALAFDMAPCVTSTMLIDSALLKQVFPLSNRPGADDLGLMIELACRSRFIFVDEVLVTRAVEPDARSRSPGVIEGRRSIIDEYAGLYDAHPSARKQAVADTERVAGEQALETGNKREAVAAFSRSLRSQPRPARAVALVGALLGWRAYRASKHLSVRLP